MAEPKAKDAQNEQKKDAPKQADQTQNEQSADFYVGVQIELNKQIVNLAPSTPINKIDDMGLKLKLESPLKLGKVKDALPSILEDLSIPKENWPIKNGKVETKVDFIDKVADKIMDAELTIHALEYQRDPITKKSDETADDRKKASSKYAFIVSATWQDNEEKTKDFFKLKGVVIGVAKGYSNEESSQTFLAAVGKMNKKEEPKEEQKRLADTGNSPKTKTVNANAEPVGDKDNENPK